MSNLFKSKLFLGVMVAVVMIVGVAAFANTSDAASCSITSTLRVGSRGTQVACLQTILDQGLVADGVFGAKTKARVVAWQASVGLVADGIVGAKSRAVLMGSATGNFPAGCTSASGFSSTTGQPCNSGPSTGLPAGCATNTGYSALTGQPCSGVVTPPQTGSVTASLASNNPAASTLVAGQATADLAHFAFNGSGTVTSVTLQRIGVSADSTPSNVYLFDGATRLTDAASVSSNGTVTFTAPSGLFTVNGSRIISVKSDIAASTSGQTVGVMLKSFTTPAGTVTANLSGNVHTIASATLATVASSGTVTPSGATLNPGAAVTVWQDTLTISTRDVWMKRLALRNIGSASASAFANFKLYVNGVQVATATGLDANGYVTFDMAAAPVLLGSGSRVIRVDADIVSGASRTVHFSLRSSADVDFVDSSFGVNIAPTSTPWSPSAASTISGSSGGSLTIEKDPSSSTGNVSEGTNDKVLGVFKVTAFGEPMKIETLRAAFTGSDADVDSLRNGRILINGVQYGSTATLMEDSSSPAYTSYTLNYTVMPGTPVLLELRADTYDNDGTDNLSNNDTIIGVIAAGSSNVQKVDSLGTVSAPSAAVSANTLTIAAAAITLTEDTTYADQSVSLPATNFKIGDWNLAGSSTEDVLLTTLSFDVDEVTVSADDFNESDLTNMYVVVKNSAGTIVAQPAPLATVAAADNNFSINYTLAKNTSVMIELYANLGSTVTVGEKFKTDLTVTGTALVSGTAVTATSADTNGQDITSGTASITATVDASSPITAIVYDNQTVTSAAFKFAALTAGYNVTDLTFTIPAAGATSVQSVELYDGATLVASRPGAATVTFNGLNWSVPANTNKVLTVKLVLGTVGVGAGTSGASLLTTVTDFTATNASSGVSAAGTESNPAAAVRYVYASIPVIEKVALADETLNNGENALIRFNITSQGGPVEWDWLFFEVTQGASVALSDATIWDVTGGANAEVAGTDTFADVTNSDATCDVLALSCTIQFTPTAVQSVSGTKTYELRATAASVTVDADSVVTRMAQDATYAAPDQVTDVDADTDVTIIWSDISASGHATTTNDWSGDFGVRMLPISQTISS